MAILACDAPFSQYYLAVSWPCREVLRLQASSPIAFYRETHNYRMYDNSLPFVRWLHITQAPCHHASLRTFFRSQPLPSLPKLPQFLSYFLLLMPVTRRCAGNPQETGKEAQCLTRVSHTHTRFPISISILAQPSSDIGGCAGESSEGP